MSDCKQRLRDVLEPILASPDPRPAISTYHDMPYAIFRYDPDDEFVVRTEISLLRTRLEQAGKRVMIISLADCLLEALSKEGMDGSILIEAEKSVGLERAVETVHHILSDYCPLEEIVAMRLSGLGDPCRDVAFIVRAGALFPVYRTSSLLEQLKGRVAVPTVLFYPGVMDGPAGLRFMGELDAEHNYRPRIF